MLGEPFSVVVVSGARSGVLLLKFSHVVHQRLHARQRNGVVDAGAHAAHGLVALELQQAARLGAGQEGVVARFVAQLERHVHARAVGCINLVDVQLRGIDVDVSYILQQDFTTDNRKVLLVDISGKLKAIQADIAKVKEIEPSEYPLLREGQIVFTCILPAANPEEVDALLSGLE